MDASFWHETWERNQIGFHQSQANPFLVKYLKHLSLPKGARVFVPLCGKTLDIHWLLAHGYGVAGSELSKIAIDQLFSELGLKPSITPIDQLIRFSAKGIDIFVGDIFNLSPSLLGPIDAIYDRAALVALPKLMRERYAPHLINITNRAPQLLISFAYDQHLLDGPPFSVSDEEIARHYQETYHLKLLASADIKGGLKGKCPATENVWLLE